jgi:uncharacterized protein YbjT (DUF2867 family)
MTVLLTGATGNVGPHVARALAAGGTPVRALTRDPGRAARVLPGIVEVVTGDPGDAATLRRALAGAQALLLLTEHGPDMAARQIAMLRAAASTGTRVVKISGTSAAIRPDGPDACRQHWEVEQQLAKEGVDHVILRPNAYMQTLLVAMAASVRASGTIPNPLGSAGLSLVDCADVGDAAAEVLTTSRHDGSTFVLTGPSAPSYHEIAAMIAAVTGTPVSVRDISPQQAGAAVLARGGTPWEARHLQDMLTLFGDGESEYVTSDVRALTGHPPGSVEDFIRARRAEFQAR